MVRLDLHDPLRSLAEGFGHLIDHDRQQVQQFIVDPLRHFSLAYNILAKEVGGIAPFLAILDVCPQRAFVHQVELATELHAHLCHLGGTFGGLIEDPAMLEVGCIVVEDGLRPMTEFLSRRCPVQTVGEIAPEVEEEREEEEDRERQELGRDEQHRVW